MSPMYVLRLISPSSLILSVQTGFIIHTGFGNGFIWAMIHIYLSKMIFTCILSSYKLLTVRKVMTVFTVFYSMYILVIFRSYIRRV